MKNRRSTTALRAAMGIAATICALGVVVVASSQSVVSFTLVNADTDQPIAGFEPLRHGATINLANLPTRNLNIRANTSPATVGSVRIVLNSSSRVENVSPYAYFGDSSGDYRAGRLSPGSYTLQATAYTGSNATGTASAAYKVQFVVVDETTSAPSPSPEPEPEPEPSPSPSPSPSPGNSLLQGPATLIGEFKKYHRLTMLLDGPFAGEADSFNPFTNYRLDVLFVSPSGRRLTVPGHYAADGNAGETGGTGGNQWRAYLSPDEQGLWKYQVSFRRGTDVAVASDSRAGNAVAPDGHAGSFQIAGTDKASPDFRGRGRLRYVGGHRLQFSETGEYFLKAGAGSPENLLAYRDFDGTYDARGSFLHQYDPHVRDWRSGDPTWQGGHGKGLIGALNYLASKKMNSVYFLTMNVQGDGDDVWPWTSHTERLRYDVSKLDQWEIVFSHMDRLGIAMHVITQEQENDQLLDGGALGKQRRLYYRELISRFAHHLGVTWNLGEENTNTHDQRKQFAAHIRNLDPYQHLIKVHTTPGAISTIFTPLLGYSHLQGASLQTTPKQAYNTTLEWVSKSKSSGMPWVVDYDEQGPASVGVAPDSVDYNHDTIRRYALWGNLMAGGGGVEWYFGDAHPEHDLTCEDWRTRDNMWNLSRHALEFFQKYVPVHTMTKASASSDAYVLAQTGDVYAVYLPDGGSGNVDLGSSSSSYTVQWYNPRKGGALLNGAVSSIKGPGVRSIGSAPFSGDAAAVVKRSSSSNDGNPTPTPTPTPGYAVSGITLINADTNQPIAGFNPIANGATIVLSKLPTQNVNMRANTSPTTVGSVRFSLNGTVRVESSAPYAYFGDSNGNYAAGRLNPGSYTMNATAYSGTKATGTAGSTLSIRFTVQK